MHPNASLDTADLIFWIDTNTKVLAGQKIHTTAIVRAQPIGRTAQFTYLAWERVRGFEFRGEVERPEAFAWCELIEGVRRDPRRLLQWRICIVVDSDLGKLADINARRQPVWRDYWLPPNFELLYASADAGGGEPLNWLMAIVDRQASLIYDSVARRDPDGRNASEVSRLGGPAIRSWSPTP